MTVLLKQIQNDLYKYDIDAVIFVKSDPFLSGYYAPYKDRLKDVTGFSGSAGVCVVLKDKGFLFVDSRYTEQAKMETSFTVFEVPKDITLSNWILENMKGKKVFFDGKVHSYSWYMGMQKLLNDKDVVIEPLNEELIDSWFKTKPFNEESFDYSLQYAGESSADKIKRVTSYLIQKNLDFYICLSAENTSWLLNKRSVQKSEYPVVYQRILLKKDGTYVPFNDEYLNLKGKVVALDFRKANVSLVQKLQKMGAILKDENDFIDDLKSIKNETEVKNIKDACLFESAVVSKFLAYIEQKKQFVDEIDCDIKLKELRSKSPLYFDDSFQTIAASGVHAAMAHYSATKETSCKITDNPLLLVDTGGHYLNGTTDMTRTIAIGDVTLLMKKRYTDVLKGHIALAQTRLKENQSTSLLDEKAHCYLRESGVDFYHATGHGIGMMLGVHEYPPIVSPHDEYGLKPSMLFSNEPAYYSIEDGFGIRLENMLLSVKDGDDLILENLLFIPFDYRLIDFDLLTDEEFNWLKNYHIEIEKRVFPLLEMHEQQILKPFIDVYKKGV